MRLLRRKINKVTCEVTMDEEGGAEIAFDPRAVSRRRWSRSF